MDLSPTIRDRIFSAADALYQAAGRQGFPTVGAVRKAAKTNMNDTSSGMRAWRRLQSAQLETGSVLIPDMLQQSSATLLSALWSEAVAQAKQTLRAAQSEWELERSETEALREQMANAYEAQAAELETADSELNRLRTEIERLINEQQETEQRGEDAQRESALAKAAAGKSEIRAIEIERRAAGLQSELEHAHASLAGIVNELSEQRRGHESEALELRREMDRVRAIAERQEEALRSELAMTRNELALLRAKIDTVMPPVQPEKSSKRANKKAYGTGDKKAPVRGQPKG